MLRARYINESICLIIIVIARADIKYTIACESGASPPRSPTIAIQNASACQNYITSNAGRDIIQLFGTKASLGRRLTVGSR